MNRIKKRELEERIRQMDSEPYTPSQEKIEEIKQRAYDNYIRQIGTNGGISEKRGQKRSIMRRMVVVAAVAVCFFIATIVYSTLAPVTTANANNLGRRFAVWINNQLHLGITFSTPVFEEENTIFADGMTFDTVEEAAKHLRMPIIYLADNEAFKLDGIDLTEQNDEYQKLRVRYLSKADEVLTIIIEPLGDANAIGVNTAVVDTVETPIGTMYLWQGEDGSFAEGLFQAYGIHLVSTQRIGELKNLCRLLRTINSQEY